MKIDRRSALAILVTALIFVSGFLLRDFLLVNFVQPIALLLWIGNRILASIDQSFYWTGLILLLSFITLRRGLRHLYLEESSEEDRNVTLNNILHWRTLILMTVDESDKLNYLKHALQRMLKDIYAAKQPSQAPWQVYQRAEQGDIQIPQSIREFLMLGPAVDSNPETNQRLKRLWQAFTHRLSLPKKQSRAAVYHTIAETIAFMEKELENDNEQ